VYRDPQAGPQRGEGDAEVTKRNFNRIAEGLKDAANIAACDHAGALPFGQRWRCPACGGQFNVDPRKAAP
jgi:hypothetical protein